MRDYLQARCLPITQTTECQNAEGKKIHENSEEKKRTIHHENKTSTGSQMQIKSITNYANYVTLIRVTITEYAI